MQNPLILRNQGIFHRRNRKLRYSFLPQPAICGMMEPSKQKGMNDMEARIFYFFPLVLLEIALVSFLIFIFVKLLILVFRALHKYVSSEPQRTEELILRRSLGEVLKEHRARCGMTQEFLAEAMGVSRQAVSKWENGTADPSTSNLLKLAKLYGIAPEDLIRAVRTEQN